MTIICSHCGVEIKSREAHYAGVRDDKPYAIHPACREAWLTGVKK